MKTTELNKQTNAVEAHSRIEWRNWLCLHHRTATSVWLIIYHKDSNQKSVYYDEAVEEALCFGWIDSKPNKRDDNSYYLFFAPRKPKSNWSKANRERAEKMIEAGLMTDAGLDLINLAKNTGTWLALEDVQNEVLPSDLEQALSVNKIAFNHFMSFPPSSKRIILEWILNAKRPETRAKRIEETVQLAEKNIKANHYRQ